MVLFSTTTYVYTDNNQYNTYYQYSGNVHSPSQTYMLHSQGPQSPVSIDEDGGAGLGTTTRASPATVSSIVY
uniref:Doublesex and mab-3 related transcription factor 1 n=1 Tax=Heterorhabditis bacteriophora TaxID=37862 RepID=A0A1I7XPC2_HETBA